MLFAADLKNQKLIVGLTSENIRRLQQGEPIEKPLDEVPGLGDWVLLILGPDDTLQLVRRYHEENPDADV